MKILFTNLTAKQDGIIEIFDVLGKRIYVNDFEHLTSESVEADLSQLRGGVYFVSLRTGKDLITRKLMIR